MNWQTLSTDSPYKTAVAIQERLQEGRIAEAASGLEELIDAKRNAEAEMGRRSSAESLTWQEVFDTVYALDGE